MPTPIIPRFSSLRVACKQWSAGLGVLILLIGALAGLSPIKMMWAAGPLLLVGLVDAGYAAQERRYGALLASKKVDADFGVLPPEGSGATITRTALAVLSPAIWPFYLGLFTIIAIGGEQMSASNSTTPLLVSGPAGSLAKGMVRPVVATVGGAGCGSGGCGSAGGCGSGSCGASSGQGCSCGGGATKPVQSAPRPLQGYVQTANGPMPIQMSPQQLAQYQSQQGQRQMQRLPNGAVVMAPQSATMNPANRNVLPGAVPSYPPNIIPSAKFQATIPVANHSMGLAPGANAGANNLPPQPIAPAPVAAQAAVPLNQPSQPAAPTAASPAAVSAATPTPNTTIRKAH